MPETRNQVFTLVGEENKVPEVQAPPLNRPDAGSEVPAIFQSHPFPGDGGRGMHTCPRRDSADPLLLLSASLGRTLRDEARQQRKD